MKFNLCDYKDAYILVVRGNITIIGYQVTQVTFENCARFTKCITKIYVENLEKFTHANAQFNKI